MMKEIVITSSVLIICVMLVRHFFKGKISSRLQYALWILVAIRLIVPVSMEIYLSIGTFDEFRIMDLVEKLEAKIGDFAGQLEQPISFTLNMNSQAGKQMAEYILGEEISDTVGEDGPTSVFIAGKTGLTWLDILKRVWFGGMAIMAVWMLAVNFRFSRKLHSERHEFPVPENVLLKLNAKAAVKRQNGKYKVKIFTVEHLTSPCLYGLPGREAIYLPETVTGDENRLRHVLTHEMCHKRHGDGFWSLLRSILLVCYWFHPLVWAAAVLSRRDCELACDEGALLMLGEEERIGYGKTLLSIISGKGRLSDFACTATTMTGSGKSIKERIRNIAEKPKVPGTAVAAVMVLIMATSVLAFTKSPLPAWSTWDRGTLYIMTADKRIILPDSIAGISGYAEDENGNDLVIYQTASGKEVGRFCTVSYEEAKGLVDAGRTVVALGSYNYGKNEMLKEYMGLITPHTYISSETYLPDETVTEHDYIVPQSGENQPFEFDGRREWGWAQDEVNQSEKNPFAFDGKYEWENENQPESITEGAITGGTENAVPGTDINDETTYVIPDDAIPSEGLNPVEESVTYLPDEEITTVAIPSTLNMTDCYIYLSADYSEVEDKDFEEIIYIDNELKTAAGEVIVTGINRGITEDTFKILSEHKTHYLGDNSEVSALVNALPLPEGLSYGGIELTTSAVAGEAQNYSLQINCDWTVEKLDAARIDRDVLFMDATMLFATIENLEECVFALSDGEDLATEDIVYSRTETTEQLGVENLWQDSEGEELQVWLKDVHRLVMTALFEKS